VAPTSRGGWATRGSTDRSVARSGVGLGGLPAGSGGSCHPDGALGGPPTEDDDDLFGGATPVVCSCCKEILHAPFLVACSSVVAHRLRRLHRWGRIGALWSRGQRAIGRYLDHLRPSRGPGVPGNGRQAARSHLPGRSSSTTTAARSRPGCTVPGPPSWRSKTPTRSTIATPGPSPPRPSSRGTEAGRTGPTVAPAWDALAWLQSERVLPGSRSPLRPPRPPAGGGRFLMGP